MTAIKRLRGIIAGMAIALSLLAAVPASAATTAARPASACSSGSWQVVNSPGTFDSGPNRNYSDGMGVGNGTCLAFDCYLYGAPAGPYGDPLWYESGFGEWINDHYLNTPGTAASPDPQGSHCWGAGPTEPGQSVGWSTTFTAVNSPGFWGNSPTFARDVSGIEVHNGDTIGLNCYLYGNPTGPYGNTLWYLAEDISTGTFGWINDHYLTTPGTAASPQPQTGRCTL